MRAVLPNPEQANGDRVFAAGMFVRVRAPLGQPRRQLLVPGRAVVRLQNIRLSRWLPYDAEPTTLEVSAVVSSFDPETGDYEVRATIRDLGNSFLKDGANKPAAEGTVVIRGGTLIDGTGATPVRDAVVVVENGRFVAAGRREFKHVSDASAFGPRRDDLDRPRRMTVGFAVGILPVVLRSDESAPDGGGSCKRAQR